MSVGVLREKVLFPQMVLIDQVVVREERGSSGLKDF
jgi:hypothetical protein